MDAGEEGERVCSRAWTEKRRKHVCLALLSSRLVIVAFFVVAQVLACQLYYVRLCVCPVASPPTHTHTHTYIHPSCIAGESICLGLSVPPFYSIPHPSAGLRWTLLSLFLLRILFCCLTCIDPCCRSPCCPPSAIFFSITHASPNPERYVHQKSPCHLYTYIRAQPPPPLMDGCADNT